MPSPATATEVERFVRSFVDRYVEDNRSVMITSAFDVAYGGCGPFAEELVEAMRETFPGIEAHDRDTDDMLSADPDLPTPRGFAYDFHVYVEATTRDGTLFYDATAPQGVPSPSMLPFNAEQIRHARASADTHADDD